MSDLTYDPKENLVASDALEDAVRRLGEHIVSVTVMNRNETARVMQVLASFPAVPQLGDIITLPDGTLASVILKKFNIIPKTDAEDRRYYRALADVVCVFADTKEEAAASP